MWQLFHQFINELKTVAVSFKDESVIEFPSFAFCDSDAFKEKVAVTSNATLYNAVTYNIENEISIQDLHNFTDTYLVETFPTISNGYCTLYQIHGKYDIGRILGTIVILTASIKCIIIN